MLQEAREMEEAACAMVEQQAAAGSSAGPRLEVVTNTGVVQYCYMQVSDLRWTQQHPTTDFSSHIFQERRSERRLTPHPSHHVKRVLCSYGS